MHQRNSALLNVQVPVAAILLPHPHHGLPGRADQLLVPPKRRLEAVVVRELRILELLEDEREVQDHEEVGLHFEAIEKELAVALQHLQDEEYDPIVVVAVSDVALES